MVRDWDRDGPPDEEAYSRVSRDLTVVTAGFADFLDHLPETLIGEYDCVLREPVDEELDRLRTVVSLDHGFVVVPSDSACAALVLGRGSFESGVAVAVAVGRAVAEPIPDCFCDACDVDSESLVAQLDELVQLAVQGFHEFRRPYVAPPGELLYDGPWMEVGYENDNTSSSHAGHNVRGAPFSVEWRPWPRRPRAD